MARKLVNFCLAWTLVLGCWGGVLAAAACPHKGCETASAAPHQTTAHAEHLSAASHDSDGGEGHSAHAGAHKGHAAEPPAAEPSRPELAQLTDGTRAPYCSHCLGRPDAPPSPKFEWQSDSVKKAGKDAAPHVAPEVSAPLAAYVREITPAQNAPPGRSDRHLLISVFRI